MRKFLSSTAGASFNQEPTNEARADENSFSVCLARRRSTTVNCLRRRYACGRTVWIKNIIHQPSAISHLPDCKPDGTMYHGFSLKVEIPFKVAFLECITPELFSKSCLLANKRLKMYMELHNNPPFPAWKDGLDEVWN